MISFLFDVDDTLYDQTMPFKKAYNKLFKDKYNIDINKLYVLSRKYSDEVLELSLTGEMSMEDMYAYRICKSFEHFNIIIEKDIALNFQEEYSKNQKNIYLSQDMKKLLTFLKDNNIFTGIITNGNSKLQWNKIKTLNLTEFINKDNIFVSEDIGISKPNKDIFLYVIDKLNLTKNKTYYIGDSFDNDVIGSKNAGIKNIWLNKRNKIINCNISPNYTVTNEQELYNLILNIVEKPYKKATQN